MIQPEQVFEFLTQFGIQLANYEVDKADWRHSNTVYRLTDKTLAGRPTFYLKDYSLAPDGAGRAYAEFAAISLLQEQINVPVPKSKLLIPNDSTGPYLFQNELPGVPLEAILGSEDQPQIKHLVAQSAQILFVVHQLKSDTYGSVDVKHGKRHRAWKDCFSHDIHSKLNSASEAKIMKPNQIDYFERMLEDSALDTTTPPTLIHGDFEPRNILVDPAAKEISGLLDFESARFWQLDWDLTRVAATSFLQQPELLDIFIRTYASIAGLTVSELQDRIQFYRIFESLHFWVWGWGRNQELMDYISKDVVKVTGITNR